MYFYASAAYSAAGALCFCLCRCFCPSRLQSVQFSILYQMYCFRFTIILNGFTDGNHHEQIKWCILSEIGTGAREQDHTTEYSNGRQSVLSRSRTGARRLSNETNFTAQTNTDAIANIISRYKLRYFTYKFHTNILKFFSPFSSIILLYNIFKSWLTHVTFIRLFVHCALCFPWQRRHRKHYNGCRSPSPVRWPGMCCLTTSETRRSVPTISGRR